MTVRPWVKASPVDALKDEALAAAPADKPARPVIKFKGKHVPPASPATRHRRMKAGLDPDVPVERPKAAKKPRKAPALYPDKPDTIAAGVNATARELVELMVWGAFKRADAIIKLGISTSYAYRLLRMPDVMAHYRAECDVLRSSDRSRMLHRLAEIAEQDDNKNAAVAAIKIQLGEHDGSAAAAAVTVNVTLQPGYVIDVSSARNRHQLPKLMAEEIDREHAQDLTPICASSPADTRPADHDPDADLAPISPPAARLAMPAMPSLSGLRRLRPAGADPAGGGAGGVTGGKAGSEAGGGKTGSSSLIS